MHGCKTRHRIISRSSRQMQSVMVVRCIGFTPMRGPYRSDVCCIGTDEYNLVINTPRGLEQLINTSWSASGINPAFVGFFPDLVDDSYATIGLTGPARIRHSRARWIRALLKTRA